MTLRENNLKEVAGGRIMGSEGVLVASRAALLQRPGLLDLVHELIERLEARPAPPGSKGLKREGHVGARCCRTRARCALVKRLRPSLHRRSRNVKPFWKTSLSCSTGCRLAEAREL